MGVNAEQTRTSAPVAPSSSVARVTEVVRAIGRAVRAHQLYLPNNPMHARAIDGVREAFAALWRDTESVRLGVTESDLLLDETPVLTEGERGGESLPWLLYKDGVRAFEMHRGFEADELVRFLDALRAVRTRNSDEDDLLTLFWESDFAHFTYEYVDVAGDAAPAPGAELLRGGAPSGAVALPPSHASSAPEQPQFARMDDFDSTLYFLEEAEVEAVQEAIRREFESDPRPAVVDALLDTFEREAEPTVRDELCDDLEVLLLAFLRDGNLRGVAYAIRELETAAVRAPALLARHRERARALLDRLSEPEVVAQLLTALEDARTAPERADVEALLARLGAPALAPLLAHSATMRTPEVRALLDDAITRLAAANTGELARLIENPAPDISVEAIRRAAALRSPAAVAPIAQVLAHGTLEQRQAAVPALAAIATPGALQILERAIEDDERALRSLAVEALATRQHRPAAPRIERAIRDWVCRTGSNAEKTLFFDALATLGGETAVATLDGLLNKRDILRRGEEPSTRAAAALALGRIRSESAIASLGRSANDKDIVVRTAVARAMRAGER